ncbi:MAG: TIR domain-containing protein [Anaerolineales bacterium]
MTDVFISYSRKDSGTARKLIQELKSINMEVWVDWEDIPPAVGWLEQILEGIERSDAFIFLVSPDSAASEVCKVEVEHARKNHKRIIPILVRDVDPKNVVSTIRDLNWIYLRTQDDFKAGLEKLKIAITIDIEWVEEHRRLQVRALEWERKKDPSLLLRGGDLRNARRMVTSAKTKDPQPSDLQNTYIDFSTQSERRRTTLIISAITAIFIMIILSITAVYQSQQASANEKIAQQQKLLAQSNEKLAVENEQLAKSAQADAEKNQIIAEAQRSAARAQIFQSKTGGLYLSTLLAIDSWQRSPSTEAESILRKNISLLPIPIKQDKQGDLISALEVSPDGSSFLSASFDQSVCVWMLQTGEKQFCVSGDGAIEDATFSPDGKLIATGDNTGQVLILDAVTGKIQDTLNYNVPVWDVNISPDGRELAIARDDGRITFFNLITRKFDYELRSYGSLYATAFSPNGKWMAAGSNIGTVVLWNLTDGRILNGPSHKSDVLDLEFSPDSSKLVTGGKDNYAYVISAETGKELFHVVSEDWVEDVTFSPDGTTFVTASDDNRIRVWDTATGKERVRMLQDSYVSEVQVSPNGQWLASTGYDSTVRVWNIATGAEMFQIPLNGIGNILAFSKDGNDLISGDQKGNIDIWDISDLPEAKSYIQLDGFATHAKFSPSGDWMAVSDESSVWLLDKKQYSGKGGLLESAPTFDTKAYIENLIISPDSNWLAVSTDIGKITLYNRESGTRVIINQPGLQQEIAFSSDGQYLITGDSSGVVQEWDVVTGKSVSTLYTANDHVNALAVSADLLAVGFSNQIVFIDLKSGKVSTKMESPGDHQFLTFNQDGSMLAANNSSGQLYIWKREAGTYQLINTLPIEQVFSMTFNLQGNQLLVGVIGNVYVLDPLTGGEISKIRHVDSVNDLSFSADGSQLATVSLRSIQLWDIQQMTSLMAEDIVATACARLTQNFDAAQWTSFFGDTPYRKMCENLPVP